MKIQIDFTNRLVKQGNSLCIRVPSSVVKEGNLKEGKEVVLSMRVDKDIYNYDEEAINYLLKIANKVPGLKKYDHFKKRFFIMLTFEFLRKTSDKNLKIQEKKQIEFIKEQKKEFGDSLIEKFLEFSKLFNKEAFINEKNGVTILKKEYR
ncbi:MAG: hypothetical protein JSW08_00870 [archaeon]|nr:MAG: hypothetical protein JSW08_00870 [archaeon]